MGGPRNGTARWLLVGISAAAALGAAGCSAAASYPALPEATATPVIHGGVLAGRTLSDADWSQTVDGVLPSVVLVQNEGCGFDASGSGFVVSPHQVLTNRHVVDGARTLKLKAQNGNQVPVDSWTYSTLDDLAVLHTNQVLLQMPLPTLATEPVPGDLVVAVGYPLAGPERATRGRVLRLEDGPEGSTRARIIRTTSPIAPGNSGGPLIDADGHVAGVVFAIDLELGDTLVLPPSRMQSALDGKSMRSGQPCRHLGMSQG